jgi:hypothetical protein
VISTAERNKCERCAVGVLTIKLSAYYVLIKKFVIFHKHYGSVWKLSSRRSDDYNIRSNTSVWDAEKRESERDRGRKRERENLSVPRSCTKFELLLK